jgi:hypothetical protein
MSKKKFLFAIFLPTPIFFFVYFILTYLNMGRGLLRDLALCLIIFTPFLFSLYLTLKCGTYIQENKIIELSSKLNICLLAYLAHFLGFFNLFGIVPNAWNYFYTGLLRKEPWMEWYTYSGVIYFYLFILFSILLFLMLFITRSSKKENEEL